MQTQIGLYCTSSYAERPSEWPEEWDGERREEAEIDGNRGPAPEPLDGQQWPHETCSQLEPAHLEPANYFPLAVQCSTEYCTGTVCLVVSQVC